MPNITIKDILPSVVERFDKTHLIHFSPRFAVPIKTVWGLKPIPDDFLSVEVLVNGYKVAFNRPLIGAYHVPNQMYMDVGVRGKKKGLYVEIPDQVWVEIISSRTIDISVECTVFPRLSDKEFYKQMRDYRFAYRFDDNGPREYEPVRTMKLIGKASVVGDGRHLVVSNKGGMNRPLLGFANAEAHECYSENYRGGESQFFACPLVLNTDDDLLLWQTCHTTNFTMEARDTIVGDTGEPGYVFYTDTDGLDRWKPIALFKKEMKESFFDIVGAVTFEKKESNGSH